MNGKLMARQYRVKNQERFAGIGIESPKCEGNIGTLFRTAACLDCVNFLFIVGSRYEKPRSDTIKSWLHLPVFYFKDIDDLLQHMPLSSDLVGVEMCDRAVSLEQFDLPPRPVYLLGSEDRGLSSRAIQVCRYMVKLPSPRGISMNLSTAGGIILHNHYLKQKERLDKIC